VLVGDGPVSEGPHVPASPEGVPGFHATKIVKPSRSRPAPASVLLVIAAFAEEIGRVERTSAAVPEDGGDT